MHSADARKKGKKREGIVAPLSAGIGPDALVARRGERRPRDKRESASKRRKRREDFPRMSFPALFRVDENALSFVGGKSILLIPR